VTARRIVAVTLLGLIGTSCAGNTKVVVVPSDQIPFQVGRTDPTAPPSTTRVTRSVFFVRDGRLAEARRILVAGATATSAVMDQLLEGPTEGERARGLDTAISPNVRILQVGVFDGVAEVDLSAEFQSTAEPGEVLLRVAQVVWTLVALPDVDAVRFTIDGVPQAVVTDGGGVEDRPVTAPDYASVAPPGLATPAESLTPNG
jgi:hypothetical protein